MSVILSYDNIDTKLTTPLIHPLTAHHTHAQTLKLHLLANEKIVSIKNNEYMKNLIFALAILIFPFLAFSQESTRIDSLQHEIIILEARIDSLNNEVKDEILRTGYPIIVNRRYSHIPTPIKLKDKEHGNTISTIAVGDIIKIISKTTGHFKVIFNGIMGYVDQFDIDISEYPVLNFLEPSYQQKTTEDKPNYAIQQSRPSNNSVNTGGTVYVKGYYRKDGTYVRPHTRKKSK